MLSEERRSISNGIWLCENCAKLIDTDEVRFPASLLRTWRTQAEALARQELDGQREGLTHNIRFQAWVRLVSAKPQFALMLYVWLQNTTSDKSARSVRLRLEHSDTGTVAHDADAQWWRRTSSSLNPWDIECLRVINPDEKVPILEIPFSEMPPGEVSLSLRVTAEDMKPWQCTCRFTPSNLDLDKEQRVVFSTVDSA